MDQELHRLGYLAGMYANLSSGAKHLSEAYASTAYARLDALWIARWDGSTTLTGWAGIPNTQWANHQRGKQYRGDHDETYGGERVNIDSDRFDAPVATVGYAYQITSSADLNGRSGPKTTTSIVKTYAPRQHRHSRLPDCWHQVGTTAGVEQADRRQLRQRLLRQHVLEHHLQPAAARCAYPFQVTAAVTLNKRTGPGSSYAISGTLPSGALGWVSCQRSGSKVGTTAVWDRLDDGTYVSDYYLATPSKTTYSSPLPRC